LTWGELSKLFGAWNPASPLPVTLHGVALAAVDGCVYVLSGSRVAGGIDNTGQAYRLDSAA